MSGKIRIGIVGMGAAGWAFVPAIRGNAAFELAAVAEANAGMRETAAAETGAAIYPDLPSIAEAVPGYDAQTWYAILAPAGTPPAIVKRLHDSIAVAAKAEEFLKRSADDGLVVRIGDGKELSAFLEQEETRWRRVIKEADIKPD